MYLKILSSMATKAICACGNSIRHWSRYTRRSLDKSRLARKQSHVLPALEFAGGKLVTITTDETKKVGQNALFFSPGQRSTPSNMKHMLGNSHIPGKKWAVSKDCKLQI